MSKRQQLKLNIKSEGEGETKTPRLTDDYESSQSQALDRVALNEGISITPWLWVRVITPDVFEVVQKTIQGEEKRATLSLASWECLKYIGQLITPYKDMTPRDLRDGWRLTTTSFDDDDGVCVYAHIKKWRQYRPNGPAYPTREGVVVKCPDVWQKLMKATADIDHMRSVAGASDEAMDDGPKLPFFLEGSLTQLLWQSYHAAFDPYIRRELQRRCEGCTVDHPSQTSHTCITEPLHERSDAETLVEDIARVVREGSVVQTFLKRARKATHLHWDPARKREVQLRQFLRDTPVKKSNGDFVKRYLAFLTTRGAEEALPPSQPSDL